MYLIKLSLSKEKKKTRDRDSPHVLSLIFTQSFMGIKDRAWLIESYLL